MIILGIDPGIDNVGYGIVKFNNYSSIDYIASGLIKTHSDNFLHQRLGIIAQAIEEIITQFTPKAIGMEKVFINKNALSSMKLSHARGAIMSVIGKTNIYFEEVAPNTAKKILTGHGHADKNQVMYMITKIVSNIKNKITHDESDALAIAYALSVSKEICLI
jgi:crossover junction endodeoxyribonuclease RuvC